MGLGRRPSVDSGYGGDVEKSVPPVGTDSVQNGFPNSSSIQSTPLSTPRREYMTLPIMSSPPRPDSATGTLLRRLKSTRLSFRPSTPTAASIFASPPPNPILGNVQEKEIGYPTDSFPSRSGTPLSRSIPSRSGTPVPPLMKKLVTGLLVERRNTMRGNRPLDPSLRSAQVA